MRSILPKIFLASAMVATAALATNNALAETMVNVPFSFTVNGKVCPAGLYTVARNDTNGVVTLRDPTRKSGFTWISRSMMENKIEAVTKESNGAIKQDGEWKSLQDFDKEEGVP